MSMSTHITFSNKKLNVPNSRNKGNSLLKLIDDYIAIDLETTGLDPRYDKIIEIGAVRIINREQCETFSSLVNPGYPVDDFITDLTGITNEMLEGAPCINEVLPKFLDFVGDHIVIGHNVNFDINFLCDSIREFNASSFKNDFIDTMRLSRRLFPEERHHRLKDLIKRLDLDTTVMHRATDDAFQAHRCYEYFKSHILENNLSPDELLAKRHYNIRSKDIQATSSEFDDSHPLYNKTCVFTGALEKMSRRDAMQLVVNSGGTCGDSVTKKTNYLILGDNDYCKTIKDGKSSKQKKAEKLILDGFDLKILSENVFYEMIKGNER